MRHSYISHVVNGGATVKVAQDLARHSDPRLTVGRYSHARLHDLTGALDALPDTERHEEPGQQQVAAATGTDGQPGFVPADRQQWSGLKGLDVANVSASVLMPIRFPTTTRK